MLISYSSAKAWPISFKLLVVRIGKGFHMACLDLMTQLHINLPLELMLKAYHLTH